VRNGEGGDGGVGRRGRRRRTKRTGKCEGRHGMCHLTRLGRCMATDRDDDDDDDDDNVEAGRLSSSAKHVPRVCVLYIRTPSVGASVCFRLLSSSSPHIPSSLLSPRR